MRISVAGLAAIAAALLIAACAGTTEDETAGWSAEQLYGAAKEAMSDRNWQSAVKYFEKLEARYPYGRHAQQAQLEIAYAYWKDNERASAIAATDRFIKLHPNHPALDYAYYLKGMINFNENIGILKGFTAMDMAERDPKAALDAFDTFKELVTRFPDSRYAEDAASRMFYLRNALAFNEVHVARYYMKRGAYVAALNRAQYTVQKFPQSPAVEEALAIMARAYGKLGMKQLSADADRVLRKNFPESIFFKYPEGPPPEVPWWRLWDPNW